MQYVSSFNPPPTPSLHGVSRTGTCWPQCPLLQVTSPVLMSFASFLSSRLSSPRSWGGGAYSSAATRLHTDLWLSRISLWMPAGSSAMLLNKKQKNKNRNVLLFFSGNECYQCKHELKYHSAGSCCLFRGSLSLLLVIAAKKIQQIRSFQTNNCNSNLCQSCNDHTQTQEPTAERFHKLCKLSRF